MNKFLTEELYNDVDDLIERVDELRKTLVDARDAKTYEDFDSCMDTAYERAQSVSCDVDILRNEGSVLNADKEDGVDECEYR